MTTADESWPVSLLDTVLNHQSDIHPYLALELVLSLPRLGGICKVICYQCVKHGVSPLQIMMVWSLASFFFFFCKVK